MAITFPGAAYEVHANMGVRRGRAKRAFAPPLEIAIKTKNL